MKTVTPLKSFTDLDQFFPKPFKKDKIMSQQTDATATQSEQSFNVEQVQAVMTGLLTRALGEFKSDLETTLKTDAVQLIEQFQNVADKAVTRTTEAAAAAELALEQTRLISIKQGETDNEIKGEINDLKKNQKEIEQNNEAMAERIKTLEDQIKAVVAKQATTQPGPSKTSQNLSNGLMVLSCVASAVTTGIIIKQFMDDRKKAKQ